MNNVEKYIEIKIESSSIMNFIRLYEATLAACGLDEFPEGTFTGNGNPWIEMEEAWELLPGGSFGIFREAIHRIMWGIPSCNATTYNDIVDVVVEELLKDGGASNIWTDDESACYAAYKYMCDALYPFIENDDYWFSLEHYKYLRDKMMWKILYSKGGWGKGISSFKRRLTDYENAIKKLIPAAEKWEEDYWYDESHIHDEIFKLYGIDYRNDPVLGDIDYGRILLILMNDEADESENKTREIWCACNISRMPFSLAKVLWPENTEEKIVEMMGAAVKEADPIDIVNGLKAGSKKDLLHPIGVFEFKDLRNSWIYNLMTRWVYSDELDKSFKDRVKKIHFNISVKA